MTSPNPSDVSGASIFPIVGIGASAGGLEALKGLFRALPSDMGAAYVVIQHLDPAHSSLTAEILSRVTTMVTAQVTDGMAVEADHVYVIPPNAYLTLSKYTFHLADPVLHHGLRMPVDTFFWSLAEQHEDRAIGVILSGTGSDGTLGLRAIKGNGGLIVVQSPETAQYDGMPRNAIATGLVDIVCSVEEISIRLTGYLQHPYIKQAKAQESTSPEAVDDSVILGSILALIQTRTGYDFRSYKRGTLNRRIARRMGLHHIETMTDYLAYLRNQEGEVRLLLKDFLIGVTAFYRDTEAFKALEQNVIEPLVDKKDRDEPIRVWVPGCSTGEEAYSIAMLLIARLQQMHKHCPVQIFASDIDEAALSVGRVGVYPENIAASIPSDQLRLFFTREDHSYRVNKTLRNTVTFALQNLINDPPFSNLDLISCRNLLIYLNSDIQSNVFALFSFALREGGYLFLGNSESASQQPGLFKPLVKKSRIYQRIAVTRPPALGFPIGIKTPGLTLTKPAHYINAEQTEFSEIAQNYLLQSFAPAAVLVNQRNHILYYSGPTARYLEQRSGTPTQDLMNLVRDELKAKLRIALRRIVNDKRRMVIDDAFVIRDGSRHTLKITLNPLTVPRVSEQLILITFEDRPEAGIAAAGRNHTTSASDASLMQQMEDELHITREDLQSNIEELESANEELQAANEEVMSINEELQSSNEELETSKEELQSMNEELTTVNSQYKDKVDELAKSHDDLSNLLSNTNIATLFVDRQYRIRRFTPATTALFNLIPTDVNRPLSDIRPKYTGTSLLDDVQTVLDDLITQECEVVTETGDCYLRRILPYRTGDNRIAGVVITFIDISARKKSEEQNLLLAAIVRDSNDAVIVFDLDGKISAWNRAAERLYGWTEPEALSMNIRDLVPEADRLALTDMIQAIVEGHGIDSVETQRLSKSRELLDVWLTVTPMTNDTGSVKAIATTERDLSGRKQVEQELRSGEEKFRSLVESAPDALVIVNSEGEIEVANAQAEGLFEYTKDELIGMKIEMLIPEKFREQHSADRRVYNADPKIRQMGSGMELFARTKKNSEIPIEVSLSPISTEHGRVVCAAIRDITERKAVDAALIQAKKVADSALATKSRFLATASHDLRQPLQSLNLLNGALLKTIGEPAAQKMLLMQKESLSSMANLLNSLLDISKLDSGVITISMGDVAVSDILERMRAEFEAEAERKGLKIVIDTAADDIVHTDPNLLSQLIQNLVSNAIRYTKKGIISLSSKRQQDQIQIDVKDSGIGIPEDQLIQIFDEFHQIDCESIERDSGLGLGLSIVQRIATLLGTQVQVVSDLGKGSTFSISLPLGGNRPDKLSGRKDGTDRYDLTDCLVLVIDDDPAVLDAADMLLSMESGIKVRTASSSSEAYALLEELSPDLILTDFHLSDKQSGIDIVHSARKSIGRLIPAILITGDTSSTMDDLKLEFVEKMTKPLDADELVSTVRRLLSSVS